MSCVSLINEMNNIWVYKIFENVIVHKIDKKIIIQMKNLLIEEEIIKLFIEGLISRKKLEIFKLRTMMNVIDCFFQSNNIHNISNI